MLHCISTASDISKSIHSYVHDKEHEHEQHRQGMRATMGQVFGMQERDRG